MLSFATNQLNNNGDGLAVVGSGSIKKRPISICKGCGQEIYDQYILRVAPDLEWHAACLKCVDCHRYLDERCTCFVRDGKTYCKPDYIRLFGAKCAKCNQTFERMDYVMRVRNRIYHIDCFHCVICARPLMPGDEFALRDDGLFCKNDHESLEKATTLTCDTHISYGPAAQGQLTPLHNGQTPPLGALTPLTPSQTSPLQTIIAAPSSISGSNPSPSSDSHHTNGGSGCGGQNHQQMHHGGGGKKDKKDKPKTTRVRTVLNEKQLHTLRTCYAANPRPDALMKEQLVEMTGLSPRVIRVWFQNKRCKDKKKQIAMKQLQQQQEKNQALNGIRLHGIGPIIASNPTRHDMPLVQSIDVQQYQQNPVIWAKQPSILHDYTTHLAHDHVLSLESQTPFQQLMHGFGDPNADPTLGYIPSSLAYATSSSMDADLRSISPQLAASDLSSPSCSE